MTILKKNNFSYNDHKLETFIKSIPKTRYYGSKRRLLLWIYYTIKEYDYETVLDAFGGTASVSLLFQHMGKGVTFNDAFSFNTISADFVLNQQFGKAEADQIQRFFHDVIPDNGGVISRHYQNIFYTSDENAWLDGALKKVEMVDSISERNMYKYFLFQAALMKRPFNLFHRANLDIRLRKEVIRQFGNCTTWNRSFYDTICKLSLEMLNNKPTSSLQAYILPPSSAESINPGFDLVYLDPPYVKQRKKDTYWKKYHFLEGIANYSSMESMITDHLKIKQLKTNHEIEKWENPTEFKKNLFELIMKHKNSIVVLSYMTGAHPSEDELLEFFNSVFSHVKIDYYDLSHALAKGKKTEILIVGVP